MFRQRYASTGRALSRERVRPPEKPKKKRSMSRSKSPALARGRDLAKGLGRFGSRLARSVSPGQNAIGVASARRTEGRTDRLRKSLSPASSRSSSRNSGSRTGSSRSRSPRSTGSSGSGSRRDGSRKKSRTRGRSSSRRRSRSGSGKKDRSSSRSRRRSSRRRSSQEGCDASELTGRIDNTNGNLLRLKNEPQSYYDGVTYDQYGQPQYDGGPGLVSPDSHGGTSKENQPVQVLNSRQLDDQWLSRQHKVPTQLPQSDPNWQDFVTKDGPGSDGDNWNHGRQPADAPKSGGQKALGMRDSQLSLFRRKSSVEEYNNRELMDTSGRADASLAAWSLFTSRKPVSGGPPAGGKSIKWGANDTTAAIPPEIVSPHVYHEPGGRHDERFAPAKGPHDVSPVDPSVAPQVTPQEVQHYKRKMKDIMSLSPQQTPPSGQKAGGCRSQGRAGEDGQQRQREDGSLATPVASAQATRQSSPPANFPTLPLEVARGWRSKRVHPLGSPNDRAGVDDQVDIEYLPQHLSPAARASPGAFFDERDDDGEQDEDVDNNELGGTEHGVLEPLGGRGDKSFDEVNAVDRALHHYHRSRSAGVRSLPSAAGASAADDQSRNRTTYRPRSTSRSPSRAAAATGHHAISPEAPPPGVDERLSSINARLSKINAEAGGSDVMLTDAKAVKSMLENLRAWRNEMTKDDNDKPATSSAYAPEWDDVRTRRTRRTSLGGSLSTGTTNTKRFCMSEFLPGGSHTNHFL